MEALLKVGSCLGTLDGRFSAKFRSGAGLGQVVADHVINQGRVNAERLALQGKLLRAATDRQGRALEVVLDALRRERKNCEAQYVDLPIGRCLVVMEDDRFQTPVNLVGHPGDVVHHVRQIQLIFPLVDRGQLVFFALSTECLRDWDDYVGMMAEICKTVTWSDSGESSTISSALDG